MTRRASLLSACALALTAGSASAAFLGIEIREDKNLAATHPATGLPGFPATNPRVFNFYAKFDGVGGPVGSPGAVNTVLSVGQNSTFTGIGINLTNSPGANFYQAPGSAGGATIGGVNVTGAGDNRRYWNTFLSIGLKSYDGDYGPVFGDSTSADPDFGMVNTDGVGSPVLQSNDVVRGGWFNSNPPTLQGAATLNPATNEFETFIGQFSVMGLAPGTQAWDWFTPAPSAAVFWFSTVFEGELTIFRQGDTSAGEPAAVGQRVLFAIPSPGAAGILAFAGLSAAARRRRDG